MSLIGLILILVILGVGLYLINTYVPMAPPIKTILNVLRHTFQDAGLRLC